MNIVGSMFIETAAGVVEIAMVEDESGYVQPGAVRDANRMGEPEILPTVEQVQEALELANWCYLNQEVFEGKTSNVRMENTDGDPNLN
jgi:hypothetical protein